MRKTAEIAHQIMLKKIAALQKTLMRHLEEQSLDELVTLENVIRTLSDHVAVERRQRMYPAGNAYTPKPAEEA